MSYVRKGDTRTNFLSRPSYEHRYSFQWLTNVKRKIWLISRPLILVSLQHNGRRTASISAPKFDWDADDQQLAFEEWRGQISLALEASSINRDIWFATIVGYLGKEGFRQWSILPISKDSNAKKDPDAVFQAIMDTLEVSTSYWNHIDEMYSDIKQGDDESIDKLDQRIKNLVEKCQYTEAEKLVCRTELLFHVTKHFEVKKWVRSKKWLEDVTYTTLLQYTKEHEMTLKDFNCHKSNGGTAQPTTIKAIESFKRGKKGSRNGCSNEASSLHRGSTDKRSTNKMCSKCSTIHAYRDCPAFGKKCHKCGNKNHFCSCCRLNMSQDKGHWREITQTCSRSPERRHRQQRPMLQVQIMVMIKWRISDT